MSDLSEQQKNEDVTSPSEKQAKRGEKGGAPEADADDSQEHAATVADDDVRQSDRETQDSPDKASGNEASNDGGVDELGDDVESARLAGLNEPTTE